MGFKLFFLRSVSVFAKTLDTQHSDDTHLVIKVE